MTNGMQPTVLVAPTAFKGTLGPRAVAHAIAQGVTRVWPDARVHLRPLSDGGTGLLESYQSLSDGTLEVIRVTGPLGGPREARVLWSEGRAVLESAEACGLHLIPEGKRDPLTATTRGVGALLRAVAGRANRIVLGLGGSGTVDGGSGMARALGWSFSDADGRELPEGGGSLVRLDRIRPPSGPWSVPVTALCDVENPLLGPRGAARVYGPQKGAGREDVERLETGLERLARVIEETLGIRVASVPGAGAAGGLGAGALAFLNARLVSGADWMIEMADLPTLLADADLLITGEGRFDAQSAMGKVVGSVLEMAGATQAIVVCGSARGEAPAGVRVLSGGAGSLTASDITELTETACRGVRIGDTL